MPTVDDLQKRHEAELADLLARLAGRGKESDWALVRALVHRAVHLAAERQAGDFCAVATLLAEMIGHAHACMHPGGSESAAHRTPVH